MQSRISLSIKRLATDIPLPAYESEGAAGMDLRAAVMSAVWLEPRQIVLVPCGIAIALPPEFEAQVRPRSGLASKHGITVVNSPGTIDSDYRGEIKVALINLGTQPFEIKRGMRIAQMVVAPVTRADLNDVAELPSTSRGGGGFGHTGN